MADKKRLSLSTKIIIGMALGIFCGLFWGNKVAWLGPIGIGYILLLQMTILPYIIASLMVGIGSLTYEQARQVAVKVGVITLIIWVLGFALFFAMPLVFPSLETAAFFSDVTLTPPQQIDYFDLYIPSNPFHSMAANSIPAVVLFCLAVGVALIGIKDKAKLLDPLKVVSTALSKITNGIVSLMPYGVFAITAASAGTLSIEEFSKLQVFVWIHIIAALLLAFLILPLLVSSFTSFRYREVVAVSKNSLIAAFVTGNLFVILPVLTEDAKELFRKKGLYRDRTGEYVDIVVPVSFNFPNLGKLSNILFVLFAVWFTGDSLKMGDYPFLLFGGILSMFGSINVAVPFLLDGVRVPADLFQLFMISGIISSKFSTMLAAMNLLVVTLGSTALLTGIGKINWKRLGFSSLITLIIVSATLVSTHQLLQHLVHTDYTMDEVLLNMQMANKNDVSHLPEIIDKGDINSSTPNASAADIIKRGVLRVGFVDDNLPFAYHNNADKLVGFDIEMMQRLAAELGVKLELTAFDKSELFEAVNLGQVDICMSGLYITTPSLSRVLFTEPLLDLTMGMVVRDYRKEEFASLELLHAKQSVTVAYKELFPGMPHIMTTLPNVKFVEIDDLRRFFEQEDDQYDGLMISLEAGMAWTLLYPEYTAVFYGATRFPVAYAVAINNNTLQDFLSSWIRLQRTMGVVDQLSSYWIKGENAQPRRRRWSIAKDVLGWIRE